MAASPQWSERIFQVADHIQTHLDEDHSPRELADRAGLSLHHFHRVFRGMTGESVMGFVRRLRLERAAMRLKYGSTTVIDVAMGAGYSSHEAFTRAFQARFGLAPSAYRQRHDARRAQLPIVIREEPARVVLSQRHVGGYEGCESVWATLLAQLESLGLGAADRPGFGLVYDDPEVTAADQQRYDACLLLQEGELGGAALPAGFVRRVIPAGLYAVATHTGPYDDIEEIYLALIGKWLPRRGVELADEPVVEIYRRSFRDAKPEDYVTDVAVRIAEETPGSNEFSQANPRSDQ